MSRILACLPIALLACGPRGGPGDAGSTGLPAKATLTATPSSVAANGSSTATITFTVLDGNDRPVPDAPVTVGATGSSNTLGDSSGTTNSSGVFATTLASTVAEAKAVTASSGSLSRTATVTFRAEAPSSRTSTVSASPSTVLANGLATTTILVTLRDANDNPVSGASVSLSATGTDNRFEVSSGTTDGLGVFTTMLASTVAESKRVTAVVDRSVVGFASVTFVTTGPDAARSMVMVSPAFVEANGVSSARVSVAVKNGQGNAVAGRAVSVRFSGNAKVVPASMTTDSAGLATFLVRSTSVGTGFIQAMVSGVSLGATPSLTFTAPPTTALQVFVSGLTGSSVVLQQAGQPDLAISALTNIATFSTRFAPGTQYDVSVKTQPVGFFCAVEGGKGLVGVGVVTIIVSCGRTGWLKVAAGANHIMAIKTDGSLWGWGNNASGQVGSGVPPAPQPEPVQIGASLDWASVVAGPSHSLAIKTGGTLWSWGYNGDGQLGNGDLFYRNTPTQVGTASDWSSVEAGDAHNAAIKTDGTLWAWGFNGSGQLGDGSTTTRMTPVQVGTLNSWASVSAGVSHTVAIKTDGTLWAWGDDSFGKLGTGANTTVPLQVGADANWAAVAAGTNSTVAIKTDGTLWGWGITVGGVRMAPTRIGTDSSWVSVAAGSHLIALKGDGTLWGWGQNRNGEVGADTNPNALTQIGTASNWSSFSVGVSRTVAVNTATSLWTWGSNLYGTLLRPFRTPLPVAAASRWEVAGGGRVHSIGVQSDGTLWGWGSSNYGQVGDGTTLRRPRPVRVGTDSNWWSVAPGVDHSLALKTDQTLWGWGSNDDYQLDESVSRPAAPVRIGTTTWVQASAGHSHSAAIKPDGTLWSWGRNVGAAPAQVGQHSTWAMVSAGQVRTAAISSDGSLWVWENGFAPMQVAPGSQWVSVSAINHFLAVKTDGTLWRLNSNNVALTQIGTASDWVAATSGLSHFLGVKTNGSLWSWGSNDEGQLGDGTTVARDEPAQVGNALDWVAVAAGQYHSLAMTSDGRLWTWGNNDEEQLGRTPLSRPGLVP